MPIGNRRDPSATLVTLDENRLLTLLLSTPPTSLHQYALWYLMISVSGALPMPCASMRNTSVARFLTSLGVLSVSQRVLYRLACLGCLVYHDPLPPSLHCSRRVVTSVHSHNPVDLVVPRLTTAFGCRSPLSLIAAAWNAVSDDIRSSSSLSRFKILLEHRLLYTTYMLLSLLVMD